MLNITADDNTVVAGRWCNTEKSEFQVDLPGLVLCPLKILSPLTLYPLTNLLLPLL